MTQAARNEPIFGIDLIRFAAAMLVVGFHLAYRMLDSNNPHMMIYAPTLGPSNAPLPTLTGSGWIGVQTFFVISGLVISFSATRTQPNKFATNRVLRLWPVVILSVAAALAINMLYLDIWLPNIEFRILSTLTFSPMKPWLIPQYWTIPIEMLFYAIIYLVIRFREGVNLGSVAHALLISSTIFWFIIEPNISGRWPLFFTQAILLQHGLYFSLGIYIALISKEGFSYKRFFLILACLALAFIEIRYSAIKYDVSDGALDRYLIVPYAIWFGSVLAIAASLRYREVSASFVHRMGLGPTLRLLGLMTFPLYLLHVHVGGAGITLARSASLSPEGSIVFGMLLATVASALVAKYAEPWLTSIMRQPVARLSKLLRL